MRDLNVTVFIAIQNADGTIELSDLLDSKGILRGEPALHFKEVKYEGFWDNDEYVFKFLRGLKKNKKEQKKELRALCEENKLDYNTTKEQLIEVFIMSKRLGWWKNKKQL